jgi:hypothetical protein
VSLCGLLGLCVVLIALCYLRNSFDTRSNQKHPNGDLSGYVLTHDEKYIFLRNNSQLNDLQKKNIAPIVREQNQVEITKLNTKSSASNSNLSYTAGSIVSVSRITWKGRSVEAVAGEWLAEPRAGADLATWQHRVRSWGGELRQSPTGAWQFRFADTATADRIYRKLRQAGDLREVRPHFVCRGITQNKREARALPPELKASYFWFHDAAGYNYAQSDPKSGQGVVVALLDTGVAYEDYAQRYTNPDQPDDQHWLRFRLAPDLAYTKILSGIDLIEHDDRPNDDNQHGTFLATLIAGRYGIAPGASLLPVKVLDRNQVGTELSVAEGIRYAVQRGAHVINLSLAFPKTYFPSRWLTEAVEFALEKEVIVVAAVGNGGGVEGDSVRYPAAYAPVIAVGALELAVGKVAGIAPYSSRGGAIDLVAPGGNLQKDVNRDGVPDGIISQTFAPTDPANFGYWLMSGTSISSAYTTGAVALLLAEGAKASEVKQLLLENTQEIPRSVSFDLGAGYGALQIDRSMQRLKARNNRQELPICYLNIMPVVFKQNAEQIVGAMHIEVLDHRKQTMSNMKVIGRWMGSTYGAVIANTDRLGIAKFVTPPVPRRKALFVFAVDNVIQGQRHPCQPVPIYRLVDGSIVLIEQQQQTEQTYVWLINLDQRFLTLAYSGSDLEPQPTTVLVPTGTGLLSSVYVFGDDLLYSSVTNDPMFNPILFNTWSMGVGSAAYPLDIGGGGNPTFWISDADVQSGIFSQITAQLLDQVSSSLSIDGKPLAVNKDRNAYAAFQHAIFLQP